MGKTSKPDWGMMTLKDVPEVVLRLAGITNERDMAALVDYVRDRSRERVADDMMLTLSDALLVVFERLIAVQRRCRVCEPPKECVHCLSDRMVLVEKVLIELVRRLLEGIAWNESHATEHPVPYPMPFEVMNFFAKAQDALTKTT